MKCRKRAGANCCSEAHLETRRPPSANAKAHCAVIWGRGHFHGPTHSSLSPNQQQSSLNRSCSFHPLFQPRFDLLSAAHRFALGLRSPPFRCCLHILHVLALSRMLPPPETRTGCHVDAVKLSSLRDRPQMPHVDVVKFPTLQGKAGFPRWGLCFFLKSRLPAVRDFDSLCCQNSKTRDNSFASWT